MLDALRPAALEFDSFRSEFLRRVGLWTFASLALAAVTAIASMFFVAPIVVEYSFGPLATILGTFLVAHYGVRPLVYGGAKVFGLALASVCEGIALGFLLLVTVARLGIESGLLVVFECLALVLATAAGMLLYAITARRELSLLRAGLTTLGVPLLVLMGLSFAMPLGGPIGLAIAVVFVFFSAAALLYRLHAVVHAFSDDEHVEGAYEISMALLVLFWNLLSLLSRRR